MSLIIKWNNFLMAAGIVSHDSYYLKILIKPVTVILIVNIFHRHCCNLHMFKEGV